MEFFLMIAVVGVILWVVSQQAVKPHQPKFFQGQIRGRLK